MIVATATDRNYVEITGVLLASIAANAGTDIDGVHIFGDGLSASDKDKLRASYGLPHIAFTDLTDADVAELSVLPSHRRLPRTAYARLLIPAKLSDYEGRLLYLDCDTLVVASLAPLRDLALEGHVLAAVADDLTADPAHHRARNALIGLPEGMRYFNSGVLLIDLPKWRERDVSGRVRAFRLSRDNLPTMDQDSLNGTFRGEWLPLEEKWNLHGSPHKKPGLDYWRKGGIIHFVGRYKPDYSDCDHPAHSIFLEYRARTPWASTPLKSQLQRYAAKYKHTARRFVSRLTGA
jgi:lipopolysaccharide biosynthesis glycosyltransferase